jgi:hypothetical protein
MNCDPTKLFRVLAVLTAVAVWPVAAQQPIIFSKPKEAEGAAKPDANLAPETKRETRGIFSIPMSVFEPDHAGPTLAPAVRSSPVPTVSPGQLKAWQKILETKNKWTLMTPEEILGIPTPEKILGLPAKGGEEKLTPEERFLQRHGKTAAALLDNSALENSTRPANSLAPSGSSPFGRKMFDSVFARPDEKNSAAPTAAKTAERSGSFMGSLLNSSFTSADQPNGRWGNTFGLPSAPAKATPQQLAGMEHFRAMMQPAAIFQKPAEPRRAAVRDPFMNSAPDFSGRGSSFAPLNSGGSRPSGLIPLPGIATLPPVVPVRSAAQPSLPPWLRDASEKPVGPPVRKF